MNRFILVCAALASCLLLGCTASSPEAEAPTLLPEEAVRRAASDHFSVPDTSVTVSHEAIEGADEEPAAWKLSVEVGSVPDTATLDAAAAAVLASVASVDRSDAPVYLTVLAHQLRLKGSDYEWGQLAYYWGGPGHDRGTRVTLLHGEAAIPGGWTGNGMLMLQERGYWSGVNASVLREWSQDGTPPPSTQE